jgi:hypothetical protein
MGNEERLGVGSDFVDDAVVFAEDEVQLTVVVLELFFLQKDDLGGLRNVDSNTGEALSFTDEGKDLSVKVDVESVVVGVTDDEGSLEASLCLLDLEGPLLSPEVLVGEKSVTDLVVLFHGAFVVTPLGYIRGELFHGHRDAVEQVTGPGNGAGHDGQVTDHWGAGLGLVVLFLDGDDLDLVVLE